MPNLVVDLIVDRVDLVEEGCNSAAFIELYKRRRTSDTMTVQEILGDLKEDHAEVLKSKISEGDTAVAELAKAKEDLKVSSDDLAKANEKIAELTKSLEEAEDAKKKAEEAMEAKGTGFDEEEVIKGLSPEAAALVTMLKAKQTAAEDLLKSANEEKEKAEAIAKAASLKNLPVEQDKLVSLLKGASSDLIDVLTGINNAIDVTVLNEVGTSKSGTGAKDQDAAWAKIENEADKIVKSAETTITKAAAIAKVIKEKPELYKEYLNGGAN